MKRYKVCSAKVIDLKLPTLPLDLYTFCWHVLRKNCANICSKYYVQSGVQFHLLFIHRERKCCKCRYFLKSRTVNIKEPTKKMFQNGILIN